MMSASTQLPAAPDIERLLCALEGVVSARVDLGRDRIDAIHVLAIPDLHPKQVVRNIEAAMSAGLGHPIDRRIVSVASITAEEAERLVADDGLRNGVANGNTPAPPAGSTPSATAPVQPAPRAGAERLVFVGYDARALPDRQLLCRVTLRRGDDTFVGSANGDATMIGRAQTAARACFDAVASSRELDSLALEAVDFVSAHNRTFVLVAAHYVRARAPIPLTGIGLMERAPEEAAILASLQAVNRWTPIDA